MGAGPVGGCLGGGLVGGCLGGGRFEPSAIDCVGTALRVGINTQRQNPFVLGAEHSQQIVRRDTVQWHREAEIAAVFVRFGIALARAGKA